MASSSIFQWVYSPKSAFHYPLDNSVYATCPQRSIVFPKKSSVTSSPLLLRRGSWNIDCFERRRMQSILDTSWSSPLLPSQISPWLMLTPELTFEDDDEDDDDDEEDDEDDEDEDEGIVSKIVYKFYSIRDNKVISLEGDGAHLQLHNRGPDEFKGSSHGWLALFDSSTHDLFVYNPVSRGRLKLPTMDTLPLRGTPREGAIDFNDTEECIVKKVILSSSDPEKDESCVAMMLYGAENRLACCHPARGAKAKWYPLSSGHWMWEDDGRKRSARSYEDIAYSAREKLFFCITNQPELEAWDSMDLMSNDMPITMEDYFDDDVDENVFPLRSEREFYLKNLCRYRERYLVVAEPYDDSGKHESKLPSQQLFVVVRHKMRLLDGVYWDDEDREELAYDCPLQTLAFDVYKFDVKKRELVYMDRTLDGLAFFVGKNHSFAVKVGEFDGLKPNSIYFTDSEPQDDPNLSRPNEYGGHDNGVYNYKDGTFSSCYYPCEAKNYERMVPAPMWFSPNHN